MWGSAESFAGEFLGPVEGFREEDQIFLSQVREDSKSDAEFDNKTEQLAAEKPVDESREWSYWYPFFVIQLPTDIC